MMSKRRIYPLKDATSQTRNFSKKLKKKTKTSKVLIAWKSLKGVIFILCFAFFIYQTTEFMREYYRYPTTTKMEYTRLEEIMAPAVTICHENPIKRTKFCEVYPNLCEIPENITEFCKKRPMVCKDNPTNPLDINSKLYPDVQDAIDGIYFAGNITREYWSEWVWSVVGDSMNGRNQEMKPVFTNLYSNKYLCYSISLLLNNSEEPTMFPIGNAELEHTQFYRFILDTRSSDDIQPRESKVSMSIHSPFEPVNPIIDGIRLERSFLYLIFIRLEEQRQLEYPYETDCTNYTALWIKRNRQGPRSQKMCNQLCWHDVYEKNKNMLIEPEAFRVLEYPLQMCFDDSICNISLKEMDLLNRCKKDCKSDCRNVRYIIDRIDAEPDYFKGIHYFGLNKEVIEVEVYIRNYQVLVEKHVPRYNLGDLFSYVGGLMGCWLGVSIWAFAGIAEDVFRKSLQWVKQIKRYFKGSSLFRNTTFSINRNSIHSVKY